MKYVKASIACVLIVVAVLIQAIATVVAILAGLIRAISNMLFIASEPFILLCLDMYPAMKEAILGREEN